METKTIYVAFDGIEFHSEDIAIQHEQHAITDWINKQPGLYKIVKALDEDGSNWFDDNGPGENISDREVFCQLLLKAAVALKGKLP